jgi:hypothetical protein
MIEKSPLPFFAKERNWPDIIFQRWGKKSLQNCLKSLFKKKTLFSIKKGAGLCPPRESTNEMYTFQIMDL